jgi:MFS family permease
VVADIESDRVRRWGLTAVLTSAVVTGLTIGMTIPLIALTMTAAGTGAAVVGLNAAMAALGVLVVAPLAPWLIARLGLVETLVLGALASAISLVLFPVFDSVVVWFGLRFGAGLGLALLWVVSETWLGVLATDQSRGRVVGLYSTLWCAGMAGGPLLLQLTTLCGWPPFVVSAALVLLATVPPILGRAAARRRFGDGETHRWSWPLLRKARGMILAGFVAGFVETALFTLLPLYGVAVGLGQAQAVLMLSVFAVGSLALQLPLGWLADRLGLVWVLMGAALTGVAVALALPSAVLAGWPLWPLLFVWGGVVSGFYTLGLTQLGQRFAAVGLAQANVVFIMAYTVGTIGGPPMVGAALDLWAFYGLPLVVVGVYGAFLLSMVPACWRLRRGVG